MSQPGDFTALAVALPELEPVVAHWRSRFDAEIKDVPAHVTLLTPWIPPAELTEDDLRLVAELARQWPRFEVNFSRFEVFEPAQPGGPFVHWLAPEPDEQFRQLTEDLALVWPEYPSYQGAYGGDPAPHLTLASTPIDDDELTALLADVDARLPVSAVAAQLSVFEIAGGQCRSRASYPLAGKSLKR